MFNTIKRLLFIGTENQTNQNIHRVLAINTIALSSSVASFIYLIFYIYIKEPIPIFINVTVLFLYNYSIYLNYKSHVDVAGIWVMTVYTVHVFTLGELIFASPTGFHYYLMAVPAVSFFVLSQQQIVYRWISFVLPILLFLFGEFVDLPVAYIHLSERASKNLYFSSILLMFSGIISTVYIFSHSIRQYEASLEKAIQDLKKAMSEIKTLKGLIPICASCKKIRDDKGYWNQLETHIQQHSDAQFSHGLCPDCQENLYGDEDWYKDMKKNK